MAVKKIRKFCRNSIEFKFNVPNNYIFTKEWSLFNLNAKEWSLFNHNIKEKQKCFEASFEIITHFKVSRLEVELTDEDFR